MAQITLRDYLQQTEDAISSSRVDDALTHCQFMLSYFPEALEIQRLLGEVYVAQERMEEAQHVFDWVLTNDPENVVAYCNRAHLSERMSEYDAALDCYQQAYELSRGNGQIREEFNRLSEKVGQKGFMFSRAGLARLYMRGDSLSEAIQEWEAVLATAPDRLDARTGLLETYWRAGYLENVEQLAEQILRHVPGCLKALLLHASVISPKNSQRAQELLRRVEALDPDLTTAQVLFADALASHPDDPFLQLLKKAPTLLPEPKPQGQVQEQGQKSAAPVSDPINALGGSSGIDALAQWGQDAYGSNDTTLVKPRSNRTSASSDMSVTPLWGSESIYDNPSHPDISQSISVGTTVQASWSAPVQETNNTQSPPQTHTGSKEHSPEPWELLQDALNQFDTVGGEPRMATGSRADPYEEGLPLWENMPSSVELSQPASDIAQSASPSIPKQQESISSSSIKLDPWGVPMEEPVPLAAENISPPPNWLNILAQTDARRGDSSALTLESQSENRLPLVNASREQQAQSNTTSAESQNSGSFISQPPPQPLPLTNGASPTSEASLTATEKAESQSLWSQSANEEKFEEEEESFFGPSWLRSLGATTMAEEEVPAATVSAPEVQTSPTAQPEYTDLQHEVHSHTPFAQHSEDLMQAPSAEYAETQSAQYVPETNPYESWSQASSNNSLNIYDPASWTSADVAQQSQKTSYETESPHEHAYASGTSWPQSSVDLPAEQPVQWETAPEKAEQNLMTTLEELEQSLWSKGFIPLEPNSLATLATQTPESSVSSHDLDTLKAPEEPDAQEFQQFGYRQEPQETPDAPSLSSALAQLGSFIKEPPAPPPASSFETLEQNEEPSWLQALKNLPATPAVPTTPLWPEISLEPSAPAAYANELPQSPPVQVEPITANSHNLIQPAAKELQQTVKAPAMRGNPLLDVEGELEMTMKRPAVRLQSMQQHSSPSPRLEEAPSVPRPQSRERIEKASRATKPANENLSYQERLVKGYQYQLVGDYDEAMQEYRLIIRSGTDLLNEVIGNVRTLLKLAPNYSAGYRVLGDAYMRQGEYLQAMEAYNKALTMTKKVKSRA